MYDIDVRDSKLWEVLNRSAWLIQIRLVHVVPRSLPGSPCCLYIVGEGSTLSEAVISLVNNHTLVALVEYKQFGERSMEHSICLLSQNRFGSSSNWKNSAIGEIIWFKLTLPKRWPLPQKASAWAEIIAATSSSRSKVNFISEKTEG